MRADDACRVPDCQPLIEQYKLQLERAFATLHCCSMYAVNDKTLQYDWYSEKKLVLPELYRYWSLR